MNRMERAVIHPEQAAPWPETLALLRLMTAVRQGVIRDERTAAEVEQLHRRWPGSDLDRERAVTLARTELGGEKHDTA